MDLLHFMLELDMEYYWTLKNVTPFRIGLDILKVKDVVLRVLFLITMEELKLIPITLFL